MWCVWSGCADFDIDLKTEIGRANRINIGDRPPFDALVVMQMKNGAKLMIPQNGAEFLTYSYGEWQIPRRGFNGVDRNKHRDLIVGNAQVFTVKEALAEVETKKH